MKRMIYVAYRFEDNKGCWEFALGYFYSAEEAIECCKYDAEREGKRYKFEYYVCGWMLEDVGDPEESYNAYYDGTCDGVDPDEYYKVK